MENELANINKVTEIIKATEKSEDEDSDNSGKLEISLTPNKRKRKKTLIVNSTEDDKEDLLVEKPLDEKRIREFAKRNNLSPDEIKQILRKLVRNDHILALVHIQEEEELKEETTKNSASTTIVKDNANGNEMCTPKLTRAKARALNRRPIPIPPLNEITPEPDIAALISQELHSDEEDEDYEPREEDFASDDDPNTTASDIDSQPRTPATTNSLLGDFEDQPTEYSQDGLFKVPRQRKDSVLSQHEEIIAKRTRSKVCMQTIPIEHLESSLVPPDISDVYDCDIDIDPSWKEFLDDFQKPLPLHTNMEDDEGDPEYVAADQERIDSEELRKVDISQKEIFDLFDGLLEGFDMNNWLSDDFTQIEVPKRAPEESPLKKRKINSENMQITNNSQITEINETLTNLTSSVSVMSTPPTNYQTNQIINNNIMPINCNTMLQQPPLMQTSSPIPSAPLPYFPTTIVPYQAPNLTLPANQGLFHQTIDLTGPVATISYQLPIPQPGSNQVLAYMPQIATGHYTPVIVSQPPETRKKKKQHKPYDSSDPYDYGRVRKYFSSRKYVNKKYKEKYEALKSIPVMENNFEENQVGFTYFQRCILEEQMRMHVQFSAQNFFQTYCHPELWKYAQKEKDMLVELEKLGKSDEKSMFNAWNLKPALELVQRWEDELSIDNSENRALMDFYYNEIERLRNRRKSYAYLPKFPPRMMKYVVTSPVFIYPHLLPDIPFRVDIASGLGLEPVEDQLMAFGMENYYKEREMLEKKHKPRKPRKIGFYRTCEHIKKYYLFTNLKVNTIYQYIKRRQTEEGYNPIKYFFEHKKAPPVQHSLYKIDLENILPPKDRINELPAVWKEFALMLKAIEIETSKKPRTFVKSLKEVYKSIYNHEQPSHNKSQDNANVVININYVLDKKEVAETLNQSNNIREMFYESLNESNSTKDHVQSNRTKFEKSSENDLDFTSICTRVYNQPDSSNGSNNYKLYKTGNNYFSPPSSCLSMSSWGRPDTPISIISRTPNSCTDLINNNSRIIEIPVGQKLLTDYYSFVDRTAIQSSTQIDEEELEEIKNNYETEIKGKRKYWKRLQLRHRRIPRYRRQKFISKRLRIVTKNNQRNKILKKKLQNLLVFYRGQFYASCEKYKNENLKSVFIHFKTLELYTNLLKLRTDIENIEHLDGNTSIAGSETSFMSQTKCSLDDLMDPFVTETKENYRKRDAIYALNFYEKVQEIFKNSEKQKEFIKFKKILRCFKPHSDRVASLYYKIENLFLPDNPELAEIFLAFLLPSEASKIGTFFKKFMLNNINNNLKKILLDFFNNHPGKLKDIYKCLNELTEKENVTIAKMKNELLPLLQEDPILIEWFLEACPSNDKECNNWQNNKETVWSPESKLNTQKVNNEMNISNPKIVLPARLAILAKTLLATSGEYSNQTTNEENQAESVARKNSITTDCEMTNIEETETDSSICKPAQNASSREKSSNQLGENLPPSINSTDFTNIKESSIHSPEKMRASLSQSFGSESATSSLSNSCNIPAIHKSNGENQLLEQSNTANTSSVLSESIIEIKSPTWTREEDKLILEEVQLNSGTEESLFLKLINLLPLRCKEEIVERYHFLMDVLIRLQGNA